MDSTRWDGATKDIASLEKKQDTSDIINKMVQEIADKVVAALKESEEYFLGEKEHPIFTKLPYSTALRAINVAVSKLGVTLDPSSLQPYRRLSSHQTGFLLRKIAD